MLTSQIKQILIFFLLTFVYLFLRLGWPDTIEFGYDQPRISLQVMEVLKKGDFLNVYEYIKPSNYDLNIITYGAFFIYFLTPFFLLTRHPIIISQLIAGFNFLGVIFTYLLGKNLFNKRVGIFSAFFLAVFPWSVIFSRMIYNPTLLLTFVPLVMYITVLIERDKKDWLLLILPALWTILLQIHLLSLCIIAISFFYLVFTFKKGKWVKFLFGVLLSLLLWYPMVKHELSHNFFYSKRFLQAPSIYKTIKQEINKDKLVIPKHFFKVLSGGDLEFQLGYAHQDFLDSLPVWFVWYQKIFSGFFLASFIFLILRLIIKKRKREYLIFLWLVTCPIFIFFFHMEAIPRYFLMIIPAQSLLLGLFLDKINKVYIKKILKVDYFFYIVIFIVVVANSTLIVKYYDFVINYNYPEHGWMGWLSRDSDPPFSFLYQAMDFCLQEASKNGYQEITFSDTPETKNRFQVSAPQKYIWLYLYNKDFKYSPPFIHYFIIKGLTPIDVHKDMVTKFGPYSVYTLQ